MKKSPSTSFPEVHISAKGRKWIMGGHQWCFSSDVLRADDACVSGDIVRVLSPRERFEGYAMFSSASKIALRMLSRRAGDRPGPDFFRARLQAAVARRGEYGRGREGRRLVFAESDFMPGLIVDDYAGYMVVQSMTAGADRMLEAVTQELSSLEHVRGVLLRLDSSGRRREGLEIRKEVVYGEVPERVEVELAAGRKVYVDCREGHKTGIYLDQRVNCEHAARLCRGRVLDVFSYQGCFSVCAAVGAESVLAVDSSPEAEKFFAGNMTLNSVANAEFLNANAFDCLRAFDDEGRNFDSIILDPPSFARDKKSLGGALRGFKEINLRAMRLLSEGGRLLTFSCSHAMSRELFAGLLTDAAGDCRRDFVIKEEFCQSPDHPVLLAMPETGYLRGFCLERV